MNHSQRHSVPVASLNSLSLTEDSRILPRTQYSDMLHNNQSIGILPHSHSASNLHVPKGKVTNPNDTTSLVIYSHITQKKYIVGLKSRHFETLTTKKLKSNLQRVSGVNSNDMVLWYNGRIALDSEKVGDWISIENGANSENNAVIMIGKNQLEQFEMQARKPHTKVDEQLEDAIQDCQDSQESRSENVHIRQESRQENVHDHYIDPSTNHEVIHHISNNVKQNSNYGNIHSVGPRASNIPLHPNSPINPINQDPQNLHKQLDTIEPTQIPNVRTHNDKGKEIYEPSSSVYHKTYAMQNIENSSEHPLQHNSLLRQTENEIDQKEQEKQFLQKLGKSIQEVDTPPSTEPVTPSTTVHMAVNPAQSNDESTASLQTPAQGSNVRISNMASAKGSSPTNQSHPPQATRTGHSIQIVQQPQENLPRRLSHSPTQNFNETNQSLNISATSFSQNEKQMLIQQFEQRFQQQLTTEKNTLSRIFNEAKKAILKQANGDRETLMKENSRLREQLEMIYSRSGLIDKQFNEKSHGNQRGKPIEDEQTIHTEQQINQLNAVITNLKRQITTLESENEKLQQKLAFEEQVSKQSYRLKSESLAAISGQEQQWKKEKEKLLAEHNSEIQRLNNLRQQDQLVFENEKELILNERDSHNSIKEEQLERLTKEMGACVHRLEELEMENENYKRQIEQAQGSLQSNALFVQSAENTINQLKKHIERLSKGDAQVSHLLVNVTQELEMLRKRSEHLEKDNLLVRERLLQETKKRKQLHNALEDVKGNIRVIVRLRPLLPNESYSTTVSGRVEVRDDSTVTVTSVATGVKVYDFYHALGFNSKQEDVFEEVKPVIQSAIDGVNVCILAYGATGSGKTFTIHGKEIITPVDQDSHDQKVLSPFRGILPRAAEELFQHLHENNIWDNNPSGGLSKDTYSITCSMIELYLDEIRDLLLSPTGNKKKLELREHPTGGMFVQGVSEHPVSNADELLALIHQGNQQKQTHKTQVHDRSSRSHTIFTINLVLHYNTGRTSIVTRSKLLFVDLAGSERISKSRAVGERFKEAQHINKSLSALGDVIGALSKKKSHVPYRNSKLTSMLQPCLGGNAKTIMFANISPSADSLSETTSTLGFAARVKKIQNVAVKNREIKMNPG